MNGTTALDWRVELRYLALLAAGLLAFFFLPIGVPRFDHAVLEGLLLAKAYAREHVLLCLVPAFFIAGAIAVFVSDAAVLRYLGRGANQPPALAVDGTVKVSGRVPSVGELEQLLR